MRMLQYTSFQKLNNTEKIHDEQKVNILNTIRITDFPLAHHSTMTVLFVQNKRKEIGTAGGSVFKLHASTAGA